MDCCNWESYSDLPCTSRPLPWFMSDFLIADNILNIKSLHFNLQSITLSALLSLSPAAFVLTSHQVNWKIVKQTFRRLLWVHAAKDEERL